MGNASMNGSGPLAGLRVVELAGLGAAPYGCMMLADLGADVVRIERPGGDPQTPNSSPLLRNRRVIRSNLKEPDGVRTVLDLVERGDVLVEGFRPGVAERLGLGPEACLARNPRLIYARMTGWGQDGPMAAQVGHDLNYIGLAGLLHQIGARDGTPAVPLNVIGDFGGGGLLMAYGILCALFAARRSGRGQVVDAAMVDGALSFMSMALGDRAVGQFPDRTGEYWLGGGAPYYNVYATADGAHLAVAAIEPQFYRALLEVLGLGEERWTLAGHPNVSLEVRAQWPSMRDELAAIFRAQPLLHWLARFESVDACVTPVLTLDEALEHPHHRARSAFVELDGRPQPTPAPRFDRTPAAMPRMSTHVEAHEVVEGWVAER